jgi:hypothetical protein
MGGAGPTLGGTHRSPLTHLGRRQPPQGDALSLQWPASKAAARKQQRKAFSMGSRARLQQHVWQKQPAMEPCPHAGSHPPTQPLVCSLEPWEPSASSPGSRGHQVVLLDNQCPTTSQQPRIRQLKRWVSCSRPAARHSCRGPGPAAHLIQTTAGAVLEPQWGCTLTICVPSWYTRMACDVTPYLRLPLPTFSLPPSPRRV